MSFESHKYGNDILAAVADYASTDRPLDEFGSVQESVGWNGLVQVSYKDLPLEAYEDTKEEFLAKYGDDPAGYLVWICEDEQGFVKVVEFGDDSGRAFNEAKDNYDEHQQRCQDCLDHPGWAHDDVLRRKEPHDICKSCYGSGVSQEFGEVDF